MKLIDAVLVLKLKKNQYRLQIANDLINTRWIVGVPAGIRQGGKQWEELRMKTQY